MPDMAMAATGPPNAMTQLGRSNDGRCVSCGVLPEDLSLHAGPDNVPNLCFKCQKLFRLQGNGRHVLRPLDGETMSADQSEMYILLPFRAKPFHGVSVSSNGYGSNHGNQTEDSDNERELKKRRRERNRGTEWRHLMQSLDQSKFEAARPGSKRKPRPVQRIDSHPPQDISSRGPGKKSAKPKPPNPAPEQVAQGPLRDALRVALKSSEGQTLRPFEALGLGEWAAPAVEMEADLLKRDTSMFFDILEARYHSSRKAVIR